MTAKTKVDGRGCSTGLEREWDSRKAVTKLKYDRLDLQSSRCTSI